MQITTAISTETDLEHACRMAAAEALAAMDGAEVDLCLLFVSHTYGPAAAEAPALVTTLVDPTRLTGCVARGIIGNGIEIENMPAVSISLLSLPQGDVEIDHLVEPELPNDDLGQDEWIKLFALGPEAVHGFVIIPDPFSFPTDRLLAGLDFAYPNAPKVGGLASGSAHPGGNMLFLDQTIYHEGAITMSLTGNLELQTVVAQGCKPFGEVGTLTKVREHQILTIDDRPALEFLQAQFAHLSGPDLDLATSTPLFIGIQMDPFASDEPQPGDYLIRNMIGFDPAHNTLTVGADIGVGRRVQFHLRDGTSSAKDLENVLQQGLDDGRLAGPANRGALLFSCLGRGESLYQCPNHDSDMFQRLVGRTPLSGFFCNGEIGPVMGSTYLHGYTSAFAVLRERDA